MRMAGELQLKLPEGVGTMEAFVIAGALIGSFVAAFVIQKAALEGLLRIIDPDRGARQ
jgi:hypothetical protein